MTLPIGEILGSGLGTGIGYALSVALFIADQISGKQSSNEIINVLEKDRTMRGYLEWLRQENHEDLVKRISLNKEDLLQELGTLGTDIHGLSGRILRELQETGDDLVERIKDLNKQFIPPVLSAVPLRGRPLTAVHLLAREDEMSWLKVKKTDVVVSGQPGSGKTYLLYHFAQTCSGRFVITDNPDTAVNAVINGCPPVLIVDDAANRSELISRLVHARHEHGLAFRLITVCWPFELTSVLDNMELTKASSLELPLLSREVIAELIQLIVKDAGFKAPNDVVWEINNQAVGRPGLAVTLTQASLHEDFLAVMRGETLADRMGKLFESIVGGFAAHILAAFSVGGKSGMEMETVSKALDIPIIKLHRAIKDMAPGGVLDPLSQTRLRTIPGAMRRALLKSTFFDAKGTTLPPSIYELLLETALDREEAVLALIASVHVGAAVDRSWLQDLVSCCASPEVWDAYASLGASECQYIIANHNDKIEHIINAALVHDPESIIPLMLDNAENDRRPLNSHPDAPLRQLEDWISHACAGTPDAVHRRQTLFNAACLWLKGGGDPYTAYRAFKHCFTLEFETSETDPGDGMTLTISSGILTLKEVDAIAEFWPDFIEVAREYGIADWKSVTSIISEWLSPNNRFGKSGGDEYSDKTRPVVQQMIRDLLELGANHNGFLRWAYVHAKKADLDPATIPVSQEFLKLYPVESFSDDWEAKERENVEGARALVKSWEELPFTGAVHRLKHYEDEARSMEHTWPRLTPNVCRLLAEQRDVKDVDVLLLIDSKLQADLVEPFIERALQRKVNIDAVLRTCIENDDYRHLAIYHTLDGGALHLYPEICEYLPKYSKHLEYLRHRGEPDKDLMKNLLTHEDIGVRLEASLLEFRSGGKGKVRECVLCEWRAAFVVGVAEYESVYDLGHIYDLDAVLAYDRTMAFDILSTMVARDSSALYMWDANPISGIVSLLVREERAKLLDACENLRGTEFPKLLIRNDTDMYQQFLGKEELRRHHLTPLIGFPSEAGWPSLALAALAAGYSPKDISLAARGRHWGGTGPMSRMWQNWIDEFNKLLEEEDERLRPIAEAGIEWSTAERDAALKEERRDGIYGHFND